MTLKDVVLRSLKEISAITSYWDVLEHIKANNYYDFGDAETSGSTLYPIQAGLIMVIW